MANDYRFERGGLVVPATLATAYTVSDAYDAAVITSCLVANRTATVSGQVATIDVAVYDGSGVRQAFWANGLEMPARTSVDLIRGVQNLPPDWTVRAQASVSGAIDLSVSATGVIYGA